MFGVCVCLCVCVRLCVLKHDEKAWKNKPELGFNNALRVYIQNVSVYAGTTRTHVETCARGAGTHGDVLNQHTEGVLYIHTGRESRGSSLVLLSKICPRMVIT